MRIIIVLYVSRHTRFSEGGLFVLSSRSIWYKLNILSVDVHSVCSKGLLVQIRFITERERERERESRLKSGSLIPTIAVTQSNTRGAVVVFVHNAVQNLNEIYEKAGRVI